MVLALNLLTYHRYLKISNNYDYVSIIIKINIIIIILSSTFTINISFIAVAITNIPAVAINTVMVIITI